MKDWEGVDVDWSSGEDGGVGGVFGGTPKTSAETAELPAREGRRRELMTGGLRQRPPHTSGLEFSRSHLALRTSSRGSRHFVSRTVLIWANSNLARAVRRNSAKLGISAFQRETAEVLTLARRAALE